MEIPIEGCKAAFAYRPSNTKKFFLISLVVALYAIVLPYCYFTAGDPRLHAMMNAQKIADEKWLKESSGVIEATDIDLLTNTTAEALPSLSTSSSTKIIEDNSSKISKPEFDIFDETEEDADLTSSKTASSSYFASFFTESKQSKREKKELKELKKSFSTLTNEDGEPISLPPSYLPSAWACLALFSLLTFHALFHLLCHWIVFFKAYALYSSATSINESVVVLVIPTKNKGKPQFSKVTKSQIRQQFQVEFQRQAYVYTPAAKLGKNSKQYPNGVLTLTSSPINLPLTQYITATGLKTESEVQVMTEKFGKNHLTVPIPTFLELLAQQMVSPLTMFQIFTAILWLLDEYWTYTLMTLGSVVVFEATTVFQRSRTQGMLTSMAPKAIPINVYRQGKWQLLTTKDLLPSDIISLKIYRPASTPGSAGPVVGADANVVPCDCLILKGSAVVNEASLTGESVPQMKEAIALDNNQPKKVTEDIADSDEEKLDMNGSHRVNTLFSGTTMVNIDNKQAQISDGMTIEPSPDGGLIAFVLRTGFNSSQGTLLQMIEFSQQAVNGDVVEVGLALLMLFMFAIASAGYVLNDGLIKKEKTTHELLLKCVMILTSVVPRQLPMQMAMAVNMALMALTKQGIFCTEPHRVPIAGKISHCLFDKTGTLTTDQLVPVGVIDISDITDSKKASKQASVELRAVSSASLETAMVLAACHSLVVVDDSANEASVADPTLPAPIEDELKKKTSIVGDPIELAALEGVEWKWDGATSTASPGVFDYLQSKLEAVNKKMQELSLETAGTSAQVSDREKKLSVLKTSAKVLQDKLKSAKDKASQALFDAVRVIQRYHFSSKLQRMSVICNCSKTGSKKGDIYGFVKGSPEAIKTLLLPEEIPHWYSNQYEAMARRGLRVLALAFKKIVPNDIPEDFIPKGVNSSDITSYARDIPRSFVESNLRFAGFIAFECKIRGDSKVVIQSLLESQHRVAMVTGDALLTSLHVAKQVGICAPTRPTAILTHIQDSKSGLPYCWTITSEDGTSRTVPVVVSEIASFAKDYSLLTSEQDLLGLADSTEGKASKLWGAVEHFQVFARMSPHGKATVIRALQQGNILDDDSESLNDSHEKSTTKSQAHVKDVFVLMCGDGGNDVGALKQADIGLALLGGHANANTTEEVANSSATAAEEKVFEPSSEDALNMHQKRLEARAAEINKARMAHMKTFQAQFQKKQQEKLQEEVRKAQERGELMAMFSIVKQQAAETKRALDAENARFMASHGQVWDPSKDPDAAAGTLGLDSLLGGMDAADTPGGIPVLRPGDASIAAPFTSRVPSIRAVVDLIRQGRCTLLSALMQQQIMMLESIIAAYTLSALSLHNSRSSERQMMASSWLVMTAAVSFSYASPLEHMHPLRPLRSLFHPAIMVSILGQALIHVACMTLAVQLATTTMGPANLQAVTDFFRKVKSHEIDRTAHCGEDDVMCQLQATWMAPFLPNLLNTVVFLVETAQMISVFFTNYKGRPWMRGMLENHALFLSVFICVAGVIVCAWELVPQFNELIQLAPFPDDAFRYKVLALVLSTIFGTLTWDRLCVWLFAREVSDASLGEFRKMKLADFFPVLKTAALVAGSVGLLATGNILYLGIGFWYYRQYIAKPAVKP